MFKKIPINKLNVWEENVAIKAICSSPNYDSFWLANKSPIELPRLITTIAKNIYLICSKNDKYTIMSNKNEVKIFSQQILEIRLNTKKIFFSVFKNFSYF